MFTFKSCTLEEPRIGAGGTANRSSRRLARFAKPPRSIVYNPRTTRNSGDYRRRVAVLATGRYPKRFSISGEPTNRRGAAERGLCLRNGTRRGWGRRIEKRKRVGVKLESRSRNLRCSGWRARRGLRIANYVQTAWILFLVDRGARHPLRSFNILSPSFPERRWQS